MPGNRLNIKNPRTYELARRLAKLTGTSITQAVTTAIEESIERIDPLKVDASEQLMDIASTTGPLWKEPYKSMDHGELLFDAMSRPK